MTDDELKQIKIAARTKLGSAFDRLNPQNESTNLSDKIAKAIAEAIAEYDRIKNS